MRTLKLKSFQIVSFIVISVIYYLGISHLFGCISDGFHSLGILLPLVLIGVIALIYWIYQYIEVYKHPISKIKFLVMLTITSFLAIISFILCLCHLNFYFLNTIYIYKGLLILIVCMFTFALNGYLVYLFIHKKINFPTEKKHVDNIGSFIYRIINLLISIFFGVDALFGIIYAYQNFAIDFLGYSLLIIILIVPIISFILSTFINKPIMSIIILAVNGISWIGFGLIYFVFSNVFISIGQNLFLLDFASSLPVALVFISITFVGNIVISTKKILTKK